MEELNIILPITSLEILDELFKKEHFIHPLY